MTFFYICTSAYLQIRTSNKNPSRNNREGFLFELDPICNLLTFLCFFFRFLYMVVSGFLSGVGSSLCFFSGFSRFSRLLSKSDSANAHKYGNCNKAFLDV